MALLYRGRLETTHKQALLQIKAATYRGNWRQDNDFLIKF
jgi:hypothetical protein